MAAASSDAIGEARADRGLSGDSVVVAAWTAISRVTGFARVAVVAAVLGPSYLGNAYQATNLLPNLTFEFLTGSLIAALLVPALVRALAAGERDAERLAGAFLAVTTAGFLAVTVLAIAAGPALLRLFTIGVPDAGVAADQRAVGWALMALLMPQVALYGVAAIGGAVQNARGRFALPAGAPAIENLGVIATLLAVLALYGPGLTIGGVPTGAVLLLGLGTTGAVLLHAALQWWGAWRVGIRLVPRRGRRDPEMRRLLARMRPALGYAGLNSLRILGALVVANKVEGGVVALSLALAFYYLPVAVAARPVATALLPRLSRHHQRRDLAAVRDESVGGARLVLFFVVPAAVAYAVLAVPIAEAAAMGEMARSGAVELVAVSLASLAAGVIGEAAFVLATQVSYAVEDGRAPFRAMVVRTAVSLGLMAVALATLDGAALLVAVGGAISVANLAGTAHLVRHLRRRLPAGGDQVARPLRRTFAAALVMAAPAYAAAEVLGGAVGDATALAAAAVLGGSVFVALQRSWAAPELASVLAGLRGLRAGAAP